MPKTQITVEANSDMELLTRKNALEAINALPTDQLKRVLKLIKSPAAIGYLSSDLKFALLQKFI